MCMSHGDPYQLSHLGWRACCKPLHSSASHVPFLPTNCMPSQSQALTYRLPPLQARYTKTLFLAFALWARSKQSFTIQAVLSKLRISSMAASMSVTAKY